MCLIQPVLRVRASALITLVAFTLLAVATIASVMPARAEARAAASHCLVPNLKNERLAAAARRLRGAHCVTGRITGPRNGLVRSQVPAPGASRQRGARIALVFRGNPAISRQQQAQPPVPAVSTATSTGSAEQPAVKTTVGMTAPGTPTTVTAPATSTTATVKTTGASGTTTTTASTPTTTPTQTSTSTTQTSTTPVQTSTTPAGTTTTTTPVQTGPLPPGSQPNGIPGDWSLILDSQFDGGSLDDSVWQTGWFGAGVTGPVNATEEDCYSPDNVTLPDDDSVHLDVTADSSTCGGVEEPYTGALLTTNPLDGRAGGGFEYTYGVLEAEVYLPAAGSLLADWPAVWATGQSWPADGEDDVMEGLNGKACWTFHDNAGLTRKCVAKIKPGWHIFASDWEPGSITYYYDGVAVGTVTNGVTSAPMYIVLDNTVRPENPSINRPASMQVEYVRVWQGLIGASLTFPNWAG